MQVDIIYQPRNAPDIEIPALVASRDMEGVAGRVRALHDSIVLQVRLSDLDEAVRGDRFIHRGVTYELSSDASQDEHGLWWILAGYRVSPQP